MAGVTGRGVRPDTVTALSYRGAGTPAPSRPLLPTPSPEGSWRLGAAAPPEVYSPEA